MERRKFLSTSLIALPFMSFLQSFSFLKLPQKAFILKKGESRFGFPTPFLGVNPNDLKVSSKDTLGKLSTFDYVGNQKAGPSLHSHLNQDEVFYVLEGKYIFQLGNEKQLLNAGDLIFLPRTIPHSWVQISEEGHMYYFLQPAGKMEEFFTRMTEMGANATQAERAQVGIDAGIVNHGPSLKVDDEHIISSKLSNGFIVRNGESRFGESTKLHNVNRNDIKVSAKDTGGELSIFEYNGKEKGGPPLHLHYYQDEVFYVSDGEFIFQCSEEKYNLGKGDMIFLPREIPHTFAQLTEDGQLLYFFQPSGKMEEFFRDSAKSTAQTNGEDLFAKHGMKIVGPPIQI
jgi:quercetin dioxygenase-like cupin family protein